MVLPHRPFIVAPRTRRRVVRACVAVLAAAAALVAVPGASRAATDTVTLVGSLQSELGCPGDWDPACAATHLRADSAGGTWTAGFDVPAGSYELKIAVNDSWEENYGADGVKDGANLPLVLAGAAHLTFTWDQTTHQLRIAADVTGGAGPADRALAGTSLRSSLTGERFYFVMADRFANGDPANDTGGLTGGRLDTGFDPTDKGFYHGGDLRGLIGRLDYIKGLGTTAIWLTPSFRNRPVQGSGADASAGYHGYWVTDFTRIDPHLGTNQDMKDLIAAAHRKGMKVFFDIITNHTADVISYRENRYGYISSTTAPYRDAAGAVFDPRTVAGSAAFPPLDAEVSFPYHPVFRDPADATVKVPAWLNDVTMYHNRGDSTFAGESSEWGDFVGLDDLFTERPEVVDGMIDVYQAWADLGVDGFRIDTAKHVNLEFWQKFSPALLEHARAGGNPDFFMFGEVADGNPAYLSRFTTAGRLQAALDFGFQTKAVGFAKGADAPTKLAELFALDDYYTDTDSNAYQLPTFLGNHDMGRVAMILRGAAADDTELLARVELANELLYLTRGQPVVYYGDEQGLIGSGGDKDARQDLFATRTEQYAAEPVLAGPSGSRDRYDTRHPLYRQLRSLAWLREHHRALTDGAQLPRYAADSAGILAFSRVSRSAYPHEYLVALNSSTAPATATFATGTSRALFVPIHGTRSWLRSDDAAQVTVTVPPLSAAVWVAVRPMDVGRSAPSVTFRAPATGRVGGRAEIGVDLAGAGAAGLNQVSFAFRPVGTAEWRMLGTDDNAPYRVFHDVTGIAKGSVLEYRAVVRDPRGRLSAVSTSAVVGDPPKPPPGGGGTVVQPANVSIPGTLNDEMGCAGDWQPDCAQAQLALDPDDLVWKGTYPLAAGGWAYKVAIDKSWTENYGAGAVRDGPNIDLTTTGAPVTFFYDHGTHWVTSDAQDPIITAPGDFQSELGCPGDWQPDCMRPWLQDPDGDGVYTWVTTLLPAGDYQFKVAHGLSWAENYGQGGVRDGANIALTVPAGATVTFAYDVATHQVTATAG